MDAAHYRPHTGGIADSMGLAFNQDNRIAFFYQIVYQSAAILVHMCMSVETVVNEC